MNDFIVQVYIYIFVKILSATARKHKSKLNLNIKETASLELERAIDLPAGYDGYYAKARVRLSTRSSKARRGETREDDVVARLGLSFADPLMLAR